MPNSDAGAELAKKIGLKALPYVGAAAAAVAFPPLWGLYAGIGLAKYAQWKSQFGGDSESGGRIAPDGKVSFFGCASCGSPVSGNHPICAACGRNWVTGR